MGLGYDPGFSLTEGDKDITSKLAPYLSSLRLTDNAGTESDRLVIDLVSDTLPTPLEGAVLRLGLGFGSSLVDKGQYVVDEVSVSAPPRVISITASASPMDTRKQSGVLQSQKTKSWDAVTIGSVVADVASAHGLTARVSDSLSSIAIDHIDQVNESDMSLLTRLATRFGAIAKPAGGYLLFIKEGEGKSASGKELKQISLDPSQISTYQFRFASRGKAGSVVASYMNIETGLPTSLQLGDGDPVFNIVYPYPTREEAEKAAEARFNKVRADSDTVQLALPATPEIMPLVAESKMNLSSFGDREDGQWRAKTLNWALSGAGLQLSITGDRSGS
jgi:hypothetical protein